MRGRRRPRRGRVYSERWHTAGRPRGGKSLGGAVEWDLVEGRGHVCKLYWLAMMSWRRTFHLLCFELSFFGGFGFAFGFIGWRSDVARYLNCQGGNQFALSLSLSLFVFHLHPLQSYPLYPRPSPPSAPTIRYCSPSVRSPDMPPVPAPCCPTQPQHSQPACIMMHGALADNQYGTSTYPNHA